MTDGPSAAPLSRADRRARLKEVAVLFTRLGFTAFGGPAAHVALMENEVVQRRRWIDRQHFLDLVGALNFIPGPNSTELAIHLGLVRAGYRGLFVAGVCFITPAVLIILPLAWLYVRYAGAGVTPPPIVAGGLAGVAAVVVAVLALAAWRLMGAALKSRFHLVLALAAAALDYWLRRHTNVQSEIVVLAAAALAGAIWVKWPARPMLLPALGFSWFSLEHADYALSMATSFCLRPLAAMPAWVWPASAPAAEAFWRLAWFFLKVGGSLFGSGYVLVNFLKTGTAHEISWLTAQQLSDAVAVGQVTPGPLLTTATFIGYLRGYAVTGSDWGGVIGAVIATIAIFLPAFVLVAAFARVLPALRQKPWARGALDGMNAAVVALLAIVTFDFAARLWPASGPDWIGILLASAALAAMLRWNLNATWLIAVGAIVGVVRML